MTNNFLHRMPDADGHGPSPATALESPLQYSADLLRDLPAETAGQRHVLTSDPDLAASEITEAYAPAALDVRCPLDFELNLRRFDLSDIELSLMSIGRNLDRTAPPPQDRYIIAIPLAGHVTVGTRGEIRTISPNSGVVMNPTQPVFFTDWSPDYQHLCVRIGRSTLDATLGAMLRRPVRESTSFAFGLDLLSTETRPLLRALNLAALEVSEGSGGDGTHNFVASSISRLVTSALLLSQEHNFSDALTGPITDPDLPVPIREAQRFIERTAGEPLVVRDIAAAANLSVRALEEGFSRYIGTPPMTYVRNLRLGKARDDLRQASPFETTVGAIARRWGFHHGGRFSASYQDRYGISPSEELRGPRRSA